MGILTNFLKLLKPEENDYYNVITEQAENWQKVDNWAKKINDEKVSKSGDTMVGNLTISNDNPVLTIMSAGDSPYKQGRIEFYTLDNQGSILEYNTFDSIKTPFGLHLKKIESNTDPENEPYLDVAGDIFSRAKKVLTEASIADSLTSTDTNKPLSANMGKKLNDDKLDKGTYQGNAQELKDGIDESF